MGAGVRCSSQMIIAHMISKSVGGIMKVTKHKNGLLIRKIDVRDDYRASVEAKGYFFKNYNSATLFVLSPAQQIMWQRPTDLGPCDGTKVVLHPFARRWLEDNIGERGPDWYARDEPFEPLFQSVLFRNRKDALRFIAFVQECLEEDIED